MNVWLLWREGCRSRVYVFAYRGVMIVQVVAFEEMAVAVGTVVVIAAAAAVAAFVTLDRLARIRP